MTAPPVIVMHWRACNGIIRDLLPRHEPAGTVALTDAQLVIAREHGFESWPKFAAHITTLNLERSVAGLDDPINAFLRAASASREISHSFGTLEEAELILATVSACRKSQHPYGCGSCR